MPWYYYKRGGREGPIDDSAMRRMAALGELEPTDFVWAPGMKEWTQAATVAGLLQPPPIPLQTKEEDGQRVLSSSPVVAAASNASPEPSHFGSTIASKPGQTVPFKRLPVRETEPVQSVLEQAPKRPMDQSRLSSESETRLAPTPSTECPQCGHLLPESVFSLEASSCPACGFPLSFSAGHGQQGSSYAQGAAGSTELYSRPIAAETQPRTPGAAYPLAILSGSLGVGLILALIVLAIPSGQRQHVAIATFFFTLIPLSYGLLGWWFGRKYPALGWRWALWLAGPMVALAVLTGKTNFSAPSGALAIPELIGYALGLFIFTFLPAGLGAMFGSKKGRRAA